MNSVLTSLSEWAGTLAPYLFGVALVINAISALVLWQTGKSNGIKKAHTHEKTSQLGRAHFETFLEYLSNKEIRVEHDEDKTKGLSIH